MSKGKSIIKRLLGLILIMLIYINTFGAVVGDNDGAAFITKAEFDSMKNNFQSELDTYNSSIDNKIDGAIAAYLSGIRINQIPTVKFNNLKTTFGRNPRFLNNIPGVGSSALTTNLSISKNKNYSVKYKTPGIINAGTHMVSNASSYRKAMDITYYVPDGDRYRQTKLTIVWEPNREHDYYLKATWPPSSGNSVTLGGFTYTNGQTNTHIYKYSGELPERWTFDLENQKKIIKWELYDGDTLISTINGYAEADTAQINQTHNTVNSTASRSGAGTQWEYMILPDGNKMLYRYYDSYFLTDIINLNYKTYKDYSGTTLNTVTKNSLKDDNDCTYTVSPAMELGYKTYGTNYVSYSTNNKYGYLSQLLTINKSDTNNQDFSTMQISRWTDTTIYASAQNPTVYKASANIPNSYADLAESTVTINGVTHTTTKVTNNISQPELRPEAIKLNAFENLYLTAVAGETTKLGYGMPIMYSFTKDIDYKITIKVHQTTAPAGTVNAAGDVTIRLAKNHFVDGNFDKISDKMYEGTITCKADGTGELTFNVSNVPGNTQVWINLYGNTDNRIIEITDFTVAQI